MEQTKQYNDLPKETVHGPIVRMETITREKDGKPFEVTNFGIRQYNKETGETTYANCQAYGDMSAKVKNEYEIGDMVEVRANPMTYEKDGQTYTNLKVYHIEPKALDQVVKINQTFKGNLTNDAEYKTGVSNAGNTYELVTFTLAMNEEGKEPVFMTHTIYGEKAREVRQLDLHKGDFVEVKGQLLEHEYEGKIYQEIKGREVSLLKRKEITIDEHFEQIERKAQRERKAQENTHQLER